MSEVKRINIGVLGAARVAVYAMMAPSKEIARVNVAAVAARDPERARAFATAHGMGKVHATYDALIDDPTIDLVYIATPPAFHAVNAMKALQAGKHVLVEKPFAMNATEAQAVLDAAERSKRRAFEAFHYRHHALWHKLVRISGSIGKFQRVEAAFHAPIAKSAGEFRWDASLGGGALMDLGCYTLQWARVLAAAEPTVASAQMRMVDGVDAETVAALRFPGGAEGRIACSMDGDKFAATLRAVGERGTISVVNPLAPQFGHKLTVEIDGNARSETVEGPSTFSAQLQAVAATLLDGAPFPLAADDPVRSMAAIDAVKAAASI